MGARRIERRIVNDEPAGPPDARRPTLAAVPEGGRWRTVARAETHDDDGRSIRPSGIVRVRPSSRVLALPLPAMLPRFIVGLRSTPPAAPVWRPGSHTRTVVAFSAMFLLLTIVLAAVHYA
jgi:hypothetical protein